MQVRFGCCFYSQHLHFLLFQNMLRNEDEISIECLFHIIELEESTNQIEDILRIMDGGHN